MSITSVFTIGPFVPCNPLCKILNTPVKLICLVKQNDGTWVENINVFLINVYKRILFLSRFLTFLTFFSGTFLLVTSTITLRLDCSSTGRRSFDVLRDSRARVGHGSLFQNPTQPNISGPNPTHKSPHPTQPIIDTWYDILGYTEKVNNLITNKNK